MKLPYGPWKEIFAGVWAGYDTALFENPEKVTILVVFDRAGDKLKGLLLVMNRYFVVEGDAGPLAAALGGHSLVFEKNQPSGKIKYLAASSGPHYASPEPDAVNTTADAAFRVLQEQTELAIETASTRGVQMTELRLAGEDALKKLFTEPIVLPGLMVSGTRPGMPTAPKVVLGRKITGEEAEESIDSFASTVIFGEAAQRRRAVQVLLENCVLSGVVAVVFDSEGAYANMTAPNRDFPYDRYPDLQPIGMPIKTLLPENLKIDLNLMDRNMFREAMGLVPSEGEYEGKAAGELIDAALDSLRKQMRSLENIEEKLFTVKEENKMFHVYRAIRMLRVQRRAWPELFDGHMDVKAIVPQYFRTMGAIMRVDISKLPENLQMSLIYSALRSFYEHFKEEGYGKQLRAMIFIPHAANLAPVEPETKLQQGILEALSECADHGVGCCLGVNHDIDLNSDITATATLRLDFIKADEIAVKESMSRPYRMELRPSLSAV